MPYEPKSFIIAGQAVSLESTTGKRAAGGERDVLNYAIRCESDDVRNVIMQALASKGSIHLENRLSDDLSNDKGVIYTKNTDMLLGGRGSALNPAVGYRPLVTYEIAEQVLRDLQIFKTEKDLVRWASKSGREKP